MESNFILVQFSTVLILLLTLPLAIFLSLSFAKSKMQSHLYWSIGMWFFFLGVLLEVLFAFGIYTSFLGDAYMLFVAILVEFLALGSISLIRSLSIRKTYYAFCVISTVFLIYAIVVSPSIPIINNARVAVTVTSLLVSIASSVITFPAAAILVIVAALSYTRTKNPKMLSIIAGVVVVSIAGGLYIAAVPVFLYYSEFVGIILLWFGFFSFKKAK